MTTKVLTGLGRKCLLQSVPLCFNTKLYSIILGWSNFPVHSNPCKKFTTSAVSEIFDSLNLQKYLSYIADKGKNEKNVQETLPYLIQNIVGLLEKKSKLEGELTSLGKMTGEDDKEFIKLVEEEKKNYSKEITEIKGDILEQILLLSDEENNKNVRITIIPGIGGTEATLFANELFNMYINYANHRNWVLRDLNPAQFCVIVGGENVYRYLRHEAGVHRVQRVPDTEKMGRIHTSTCSVTIIPQVESSITIKEGDLVIEKIRSSGPGGQNVNKTESCVRITHIPSGVAVRSQESRFQASNMQLGLERLKTVLSDKTNNKIKQNSQALRKLQAGNSSYSEKIRTYHFPQNRVTDHRINHTVSNIKGFMAGVAHLDEMLDKLIKLNKQNELNNYINNVLQSAEYKDFEERTGSKSVKKTI